MVILTLNICKTRINYHCFKLGLDWLSHNPSLIQSYLKYKVESRPKHPKKFFFFDRSQTLKRNYCIHTFFSHPNKSIKSYTHLLHMMG